MDTVGVIIARFQAPYLYDSYQTIIDQVRQLHDKTVIVLGISAVPYSRRNPLDFDTRAHMIKEVYPDEKVLGLRDHPQDTVWAQQLHDLLVNAFPASNFTLYGSRAGFINHYKGNWPVVELNKTHTDAESFMLDEMVLNMTAFRMGVVQAAVGSYVKVYPTVDIALLRNDRKEILLGMKGIDQKWRLPGGFTDPSDVDYESAALRELHEECGPVVCTPLRYEASLRVDDWRYKNEDDKIITTLFSADFISGEPQGGDDINQVKWFSWPEVITMLNKGITAPEHNPHFNKLLGKYSEWTG